MVKNPQKVYRLSPLQLRLWLLDQIKPGNITFNVTSWYWLRGELNERALQDAVAAVVARHAVFRTGFTVIDGEPMQKVEAMRTIPIHLVELDLDGCDEQQRLDVIDREAARYTREPFNLVSDCLLRIYLFRIDDLAHALMFVVHHIISDGWSSHILMSELGAGYSALVEERSVLLPPLPMQYPEYCEWYQDRIEGGRLASQLDYWSQQLAGAPHTELPAQYPRALEPTFEGATISWEFPITLSRHIKALAKAQQVTPFVVLLAAFMLLLSRYTQQSDICVGTYFAGRGRLALEKLIGFFVNTLVLRGRLSADLSFTDFLDHVQRSVIDAYRHQDVPFDKIVEVLHPERVPNRNPLYQITFSQHVPGPALEFSGLTVEKVQRRPTTVQVDFEAYISLVGEAITGELVFDTALYDASFVRRFSSNYRAVLEAITTTPRASLGSFSGLSNEERELQLVEWNYTESSYPSHATICTFFEERVERSPQEPALVFGDSELAYEQLNARADRLAHYLQSLGVGTEVLVGLWVERSVDAVVGILGILKAGGAYIPLDPKSPPERLQFMLEDAAPPILLIQKHLYEDLPDYGGRIVYLEGDWGESAINGCTTTPNVTLTSHNTAYVIYTSGSTGKPRAVQGLHRGVTNLISWMWRTLPFEPGAICCAKTSLCFVDSVWEIFVPLLSGVPLVLIPDEVVEDPAQLVAMLADKGVTRLVVVPSLLDVLLRSIDRLAEQLPSLTLWITSGEPISAETVQCFRTALPDCTLLNLYGSTEDSAVVTACDLSVANTSDRISIGRPIANTSLYILGDSQDLVPIGVPGELYVGGDCLAAGYLNDQELTADKFIPNPFSENSESRLFKSGDIVRYCPDGSIDYLGRTDRQVKVRGFRIELAEIEVALRKHVSVSDTTVVLHEHETSLPLLVAYVVLVPETQDNNETNKQTRDVGRSVKAQDLQLWLRAKLPNYMIPQRLMFLDALPLTPSGKVNHRTLPDPIEAFSYVEAGYVAAGTPTEKEMVSIWSKLFGVQKVGLHDDFFEMGGDSLMAFRMISRVNEQFGVSLNLRHILEASSPKQLTSIVLKNSP